MSSDHVTIKLPTNLPPDTNAILVGDDEDAVRALIREVLQNAGFIVIEAAAATRPYSFFASINLPSASS